MHSPLCRLLQRCLLLSTSLSIAHSATPPAPVPTTDEPVALSPFVVEELTDTGYAATNTVEGSRLNTALRDTPGAISVFTRDLLEDLAATSIEDILRYDVNADRTYGGDDLVGAGSQDNMFGDQGLNFSVRGLLGTRVRLLRRCSRLGVVRLHLSAACSSRSAGMVRRRPHEFALLSEMSGARAAACQNSHVSVDALADWTADFVSCRRCGR